MPVFEREPKGAGALRCGICDINYPLNYPDDICPVCDQELDVYANIRVHKDWRQKVSAKLHEDDDYEYDPTIPDARDARLLRIEKNGMLFIPVADLEPLYGELESFSIVRVRERFYEIQGRVKHLYWVEEVPTEGAAKGVDEWLMQLGNNGSEKSQPI